jgi:hypothetical protein
MLQTDKQINERKCRVITTTRLVGVLSPILVKEIRPKLRQRLVKCEVDVYNYNNLLLESIFFCLFENISFSFVCLKIFLRRNFLLSYVETSQTKCQPFALGKNVGNIRGVTYDDSEYYSRLIIFI